jgi:tetratricopeptide (TPR) repeat protein
MVPDFQPLLFGARPSYGPLLYGGGAVLLLAVVVLLWFLFAPGPRRGRALRRARRVLEDGAWQDALAIVHAHQGQRLSPNWEGRLRNLEGECYHKAGDEDLREHRYEEACEHYQKAAELLNLDASSLRERVIEAMLGEVRRLFATRREKTDDIQKLIARVLLLQSPCPEASFWQGMCHLREKQYDLGIQALTAAHAGVGHRFVDPPLYLGAVLLRENRPQEALRYLAEANRTDGNCPLVTWQLGMAMVAAGGDSRIAVQALQRALGNRGLGLFHRKPAPGTPVDALDPAVQRVWQEALPEARSYIRRLALKYPYVCPVLGGDLGAMIRQGQFALAQAHYRLGNFQESADVFTRLLQESPPSAPLLRGLGMALVRLERYDQAYKHLRSALEQEEPKQPLTAAYLALCGAMGKPSQADDKPKNVAWAIRLLSRYPAAEAEWARVAGLVFAEARSCNLAVPLEDQAQLCGAFVSVSAADPLAAAAFDQLAAAFPEAVRPEHAWLYCRAAQQHGFRGQRDPDLFARAFRDQEAARAFYAQRQWDLDEVEYLYLQRFSEQTPGRFPAELGADYPPRGEVRLLERSRRLEEAGQKEQALAVAEVWLRLAPASAGAHDRLAYLHHRQENLNQARALLDGWHRLEPANHLPLVRKAVLDQLSGDAEASRQAIHQALSLTRGSGRAGIAFLGARLALRGGSGSAPQAEECRAAGQLLQECLADDPGHVQALWHLAAVRCVLGDEAGLAAQAPAMNKPDVPDPRFHYLAGVCHLVARAYPQALEAGQRVVALATPKNTNGDAALAADGHYLLGWAHLSLEDREAAATAFQKAAQTQGCTAAEHARAMLGRLHYTAGQYEPASHWWNQVEATRRGQWHLDEPLRATVYLSGLLAYQTGEYEKAANKFREAGKLGYRERRLGSLLTLALLKAGQRLLYTANA